MTTDNPFAEFEKPQSDRAWKLIAGRYCTEQQFETGGSLVWRNAEWTIYSDAEPEFELIAVPGGDGEVDSICIEDLPYEVEMLEMTSGDLYGLEEDALEEAIIDATYVWNFRVEEMA